MARSVRSASADAVAHRGAQPAELLGDGRHPGVGLVQRLERGLDLGRRPRGPGSRAAPSANRARSARAVAASSVLRVSSTAACSSSRLSPALLPPRAQPGPKTSPSAVTAVMPSPRATRATAWAAVGTRATRSSSCSTAGRTESGARTTSRAHTAEPSSAGQRGGVARGCRVADEQRGAPAVVVAQGGDGAGGVVGARHGERLAGPAQGRGDRGLVAAGDVEQGGDGADDRVVGVGGGEQGGRAVLAAQAELEGLDAGGGRGAVALGLALLR